VTVDVTPSPFAKEGAEQRGKEQGGACETIEPILKSLNGYQKWASAHGFTCGLYGMSKKSLPTSKK
jgi:hypothetical protein